MNLDKKLFIADFVSETREILDALDDLSIQASKQQRNSGSLTEMLRLLHTLKGSARMLEFPQIESVVNQEESGRKPAQAHPAQPDGNPRQDYSAAAGYFQRAARRNGRNRKRFGRKL